MDKPDFAALRAARNAERKKFEDEMRKEGWNIVHACAHNIDDACYCACASGGPCEHTWDGAPYESEDGCTYSATCSRCGTTAISHSLRVCD